MQKFGEVIENILPLRTRIGHIYIKDFWHSAELVQIMVLEGQGEGHKRGNYFYICILERILYKSNNHFLHDGNSKFIQMTIVVA
jgi:hypothetical protein